MTASSGEGQPEQPEPAEPEMEPGARRKLLPRFGGFSASRWLVLLSGVLLAVPVPWAAIAAFDAVENGHPALPITLGVVGVIGLGLAVGALLVKAPTRRHARLRLTGAVVAVALAAVVSAGLIWVIPFPAAESAVAAMACTDRVTVIDRGTSIELRPVAGQPSVGLVFSPGARVDARAYVEVLLPQAEAGYLVVILKIPYGLGIVDVGQSASPIAEHPDVQRWVVGGHSLGGTSAAMFAGRRPAKVAGLLFYASYPNDDLSARTDLAVASISGSNDGLSTPAKIEASRAKLPQSTVFTQIEGAVHADFGDYGPQPGDGTPGIGRPAATARIAAATTDLLRRVAGG